ncbi:MAG: DNA-binding protein [Myxococcaceae bacterium]|nr:MAG: DNA-binding protein [Myxococcaceae bacterium]
MPKTRVPPDAPAPTARPPRLLHAGEVARLAGLHKTTVLQAVRRGEIRASRTVGRSVRIALPDAAAFLQSRGIALAEASAAPTEPRTVAVLTEDPEVLRRFGEHLPTRWQLAAHQGLYDDLITLGLRPPSAIVVDLDLLGLNPLAILRSLRAHPALGHVPLLALSQGEAPLIGALAHGAEVALKASEVSQWRSALAAIE